MLPESGEVLRWHGVKRPLPLPSADLSHQGFGRRSFLGLLLVCGTLAVYLPVWHAGLIWDDRSFVIDNPLIRRADGLYRFWFTSQPVDYYPLTSTILWAEWRLWGANPLGYHVVNVLLHALSAVVLWRVLERMKIPGAWLAAALFVVHPVNVESVAWIAQRKNTLAMLFYLLSLLWYLRFDSLAGPTPLAGRPARGDSGSAPRGEWRWYGLSLSAFMLALLSKTAVAPLPLVLLGIAWWRRGKVNRTDLARSLPFVVTAVAVGLISLWFQSHRAIGSDIVRTDGVWARLAGAGWAVWFYLYKAALPIGLRSIYPRWRIDGGQWWSYVPALLVAGAFSVFWRYRRTWGHGLLLGLGYFLVMLLPVLGFVDIGFMYASLVADHWQYFAIIAPISLAAVAMTSSPRWLGAKHVFATVALAGAVLVAFAGLTWRQCGLYSDPGTFWRAVLAADSRSWLAYNNLGSVLLERGQTDEAIDHFRAALEIRPVYAMAHYNLGGALRQKGRTDEAIDHFRAALGIQPVYAMARYNLGEAFREKGQVDEAINQFRAALEIQPSYAEAHNGLGVALFRRGQVDEAIDQFRAALEIQPSYAEAHNNIARALSQIGRTDEAIRHLEAALEIQPGHAEAHNNLANVLRQKGQVREAAAQYQQALEIRPGYAMAHFNLAEVLQQEGQVRQAIAHYQSALELRPDFAPACDRLAWVLATSPDASIRNGVRAVGLAEESQRLSGGDHPGLVATLAAAYAEAARFPEAVDTAKRALELAVAQNKTAQADRLRRQITLYQSGLPYRDASRADDDL